MDMVVMSQFLGQVMAEKKAIIADGRDRGSIDCPKCGGPVAIAVVGKRQHVRAACATPECLRMIE